MTDNEIIYALKRCGMHQECCYCNAVEECGNKRVLVENTLDLLIRKDAEIERLKETFRKRVGREIEETYSYLLEEIKTEAYKDLAEKLKAKKQRLFSEDEGFLWCVSVEDIDAVVKEVSE